MQPPVLHRAAWWRQWSIAVALVAVAVVTYWPALHGGFLNWDDRPMIVNNPLVRGPLVDVLAAWRTPVLGLYAPLTYTLYAVLAKVGRGPGDPVNPAVFHAAAVLLHATAGVLVWQWLRLLCRRDGPAVVGAVLWVVHPIQAEAVAWAASLNTVLGGTLAFASLLAAALSTRSPSPRRALAWDVACAFTLVLSVAAKPAGVLLPLALAAVDRGVLRRPWPGVVRRTAVWTLLVLPFVVVGSGAQAGPSAEAAVSPASRVLVAAHALGFYARTLLWPSRLAADYGLTPAIVMRDRIWVAPACLALAIAATAVAASRRRPWGVVAVVVFLAGVGPVLGLVPFYFQTYSTVADRYAYAATAGAALAVAFGSAMAVPAKARPGRRNLGVALATTLAFGLAVLANRQTSVWHDDGSLMRHTLVVTPDSMAALLNLSIDAEYAGNDNAAVAYLQKLIALRPGNTYVRFVLANALLRAGRHAEAVDAFDAYLRQRPSDAAARIDLGVALEGAGRDTDALKAYGQAFHDGPRLAEAPARAGWLCLRHGDVAAARAAFASALAVDPKDARALDGMRQLRSGPALHP